MHFRSHRIHRHAQVNDKWQEINGSQIVYKNLFFGKCWYLITQLKSIPGKNQGIILSWFKINNQGDYYLVLQMLLNTGLCLSKSQVNTGMTEQVKVYLHNKFRSKISFVFSYSLMHTGRKQKSESSPECVERRCHGRCPPGEQPQMQWRPCQPHPRPLWWRWGCSRRRWQRPQHSAPAHPHWRSSWSWKVVREEGSSWGLCLRPSPLTSPFIWPMEIRGCGLRGSAPKMQLGISWVQTWVLGAAPHPGQYFLPGSSSPCGQTPRRPTHSSSCLASSWRDCECLSASSTRDALLADLESSLTLSLSSCLATFKVTANFSYSCIFQVNKR